MAFKRHFLRLIYRKICYVELLMIFRFPIKMRWMFTLNIEWWWNSVIIKIQRNIEIGRINIPRNWWDDLRQVGIFGFDWRRLNDAFDAELEVWSSILELVIDSCAQCWHWLAATASFLWKGLGSARKMTWSYGPLTRYTFSCSTWRLRIFISRPHLRSE